MAANNQAQMLMLLNQVANLQNPLAMPGMAQIQMGLNPASLMAVMNNAKLGKGQNQMPKKNTRGNVSPNAGSNIAGLLSAMVGGNETERTRCIWITGLPEEYQDADKLTNIFGNFGNVLRVKFTDKKPDGALVELDDPRGAAKAVLNMNNQKVDGSVIKVSFANFKDGFKGFIKEDDKKSKLVFKAKENWRFAAKDKDSKFRKICLSRLRNLTSKVIVSSLPDGKIDQLKKYIIESGFTVKSMEEIKRSDEGDKPSTGYTTVKVELADVEEAIAAVATLHNTWPIKFGTKKVNRFDRSFPLCFAFAGVIKKKDPVEESQAKEIPVRKSSGPRSAKKA